MPPRRKAAASSSSSNKKAKTSEPDAVADDGSHPSVVLIGMRGAGKTHLGLAAAAGIGGTFLDMDWVYEEAHGPIKETVATEGWPVFRAREVEILRTTLAQKSHGHVIACGGGIVETEEGRELLKAYFPVVQASARAARAREAHARPHALALSLSTLALIILPQPMWPQPNA